MKQFQFLHAVQHQVTQLFVDLKIERRERLILQVTILQLESELAQLRRQVNEPSPSSLPLLFTVNPPCSTVPQNKLALKHAPLPKPMSEITLMGSSSTTSTAQLPDQSQAPPPTQPAAGTSAQGLGLRIKQLEQELTKERGCHETIIPTSRSQFNFLYDRFRVLESGSTDTILWKLKSFGIVFDTAKSSTQLDDDAKDPRTHYSSPLYSTHPHG